MENKKVYKQIKRIKELISEETLYGKLVDKEILREGGGLKTVVDDLITYFFNSMKKSGVSVSEELLSTMKKTADDIFTNKISKIDGGTLLKDYIGNDLLNDISDILMTPTKNTNVFKDGSKELEKYSTLVNEYIGVFEELLPSLKEGNISIKELKDKKQINRLLSLVGGESGEGFYKKYEMITLPDTNKIISKLPPNLQKTYAEILKNTSSLRKIASIPVDKGYFNGWNYHWNNIVTAKGWVRKSWQILKIPFKLMTKKGWKTYGKLVVLKACIIYLYCDGKSETPKLKESLLKEGKEGGVLEYIIEFLKYVYYFTSGPVKDYFISVGIDPLKVIPGVGLTDWTCGDPLTLFFEDMVGGLKEAKENNKCFTLKDGEEICGNEIMDDIKNSFSDIFGGETSMVDFFEKMESFKQQIEVEIRKNGK